MMRVFTALTAILLALSPASARTPAPRQHLSFDSGWKFFLGDPANAQTTAFDDAAWRSITLPHDWSIEGPPDPKNPSGGAEGFFPTGVGWYRRGFDSPKDWSGQHITVEFEGVYMNATVWLNGEKLGTHPYGYTAFVYDLTPYLKFGARNVLAVRVDDSKQQSSRWYPGSGIYRHVWVTLTGAAHVAQWGVFIATPEVSAARAKVVVRTQVEGAAAAVIETTLFGPDGRKAGAAQGAADAPQEIAVTNPALWSPETPKLYRAVTRVLVAKKVVDEVETPFGIRSLVWSAEKGFLLNGKPVKMVGGSVHHDNGVLGAAAFDRAEERRVELLKAAGFNAIRTAHNPPSPAFLAACDRLGMLVMDEAFDCWERAKKPFDYHLYFKDWWQRDIDALVLRDRNHPSVVMWSIGNEIPERGVEAGAQTAKTLADYVRKLDSSRPITSAVNNPATPWESMDGFFAALDVAGYNYNLNHLEADQSRVPARLMVATETFPRTAFQSWEAVTGSPYMIGDFVWTALDYLGENGIGRWYEAAAGAPRQPGMGDNSLYPWHGAVCGDLDITGYRRTISHYRNILWQRGERLYLAVRPPGQMTVTAWGVTPSWPSWTWPGEETKDLEVEVYSNATSVQLFLNDKLIEELPIGREQQFKSVVKVPYAAGTLRAVAMEAGRKVAESVLETAGQPARIKLTADRAAVRAGGQDLSFVTAEVVDKAGRVDPNAAQNIQFAIKGPGTIAGLGNADQTGSQPYQGAEYKVFQGRALVVVRTKAAAGVIELSASAPGLEPASVQIRAR
jgi:beta-galactosidase